MPENPKPDTETPDTSTPDFTEIGGSPVPGLTLRHILRGHISHIKRIAWSPDGKYLASPSFDDTIRIWDVRVGECVRTLKAANVNSAAWSPKGNQIALGCSSGVINILDIYTNSLVSISQRTAQSMMVEWSSDGRFIASADGDHAIRLIDTFANNKMKVMGRSANNSGNTITYLKWATNSKLLLSGIATSSDRPRIWDCFTGEQVQEFGKEVYTRSIDWLKNGKKIAIGTAESNIVIWDIGTGKHTNNLEGHSINVTSVSFSSDGRLLASRASDGIRFWDTDSWKMMGTLPEINPINQTLQLAFDPINSILAIVDNHTYTIRLWEIDTDILFGNAVTTKSVNYTTAKLVLVGDSGVGKTGLGWRLAHGEFKEHASTHGQQFWSIPQLNLKRKDGTDCEAVLWDLAGQHVYRQVHSIFLDNVAAALVLFDPTNRQDPLKGAQFWLEQLKGKGQLPPAVLVGARVDRGAPALSQDELDQFCQRYGIKGGYISTSAMKGEGLDELLEIVKKQIPWDDMTATVTTVTFKRIKDYVLALKEKTDRKGVLVSPAELRKQLESAQLTEDGRPTTEKSSVPRPPSSVAEWQFTDAEMMTAVGHLETHGYVSILRNSAGEQFILLTPELLVNIAASIMLLADKNARELGAVSESDLLGGKIAFDELKGLEKAEGQILLDAAILRFLEHSICFRDTFGNDTLLIFPSLIKQKRPLQDEVPATDDISYVVRGRVENLYASLVVLLGYTPSFSRINQWQNQAQYEMDAGQVCGFRSIEEREGEIELVLYYADSMPHSGRDIFQELFEQFLYQREVEVTRFPPVTCPKHHRIERATVVKRVREGKDFVFCDECGEKTFLPDFDKPQTIGIEVSWWLQREEAMARLRSAYEKHLTNIKSYRRGWATPRAYLSHLPEQKDWAKKLIHDLQDAGVFIVEKPEDVKPEDFVILLDTPAYRKAYQAASPSLASDAKVIQSRLQSGRKKMLSLGCEGEMRGHDLKDCVPGNFCDETHYPVSLFNLVMDLYAIPLTHKGFEPLRQSLHEQWEHTLSKLPPVEPPQPQKRFSVALSFPGEYRKQVEAIAGNLSKALGKERVLYDQYYEAEFARTNLDTYLQSLYRNQSELVVVFLCAEYEKKDWCRLEWRAVRDLINTKEESAVMLMRFDKAEITGIFLGDGYIDIANRNPEEVAQLILQRLEINRK